MEIRCSVPHLSHHQRVEQSPWRVSLYDHGLAFGRVTTALVLMVLCAPVAFLIALAIACDSKGPVLYRQTRLGHRGKLFTLLKFRTMTVNAENGTAQWATAHDTRITRVGALLRKTRLDELPQLVNVLRGELRFIGPRPERPELHDHICQEVPEFSKRLAQPPGITGWAQVCVGYTNTIEGARHKLAHDLTYQQNRSLLFDIKIIAYTALTILRGREFIPTQNDLSLEVEHACRERFGAAQRL